MSIHENTLSANVTALAKGAGVVGLVLLASCSTIPPSATFAAPSVELIESREAVESYPASAQRFQSMREIFPVAIVEASPGGPLPVRESPLPESFSLGDQSLGLEDILSATDTNALIVIRDGVIIHESYLNGSTAETRFIGWSISKSVTSLLFGIALTDGDIESIDDPVEKYLPDLAGSPFEGATLRNLLEMRGGTSYREQPMFGQPSHVDPLAAQSIFENRKRFTDLSEVDVEKQGEPGDAFNYSTLTASLLGRVIEAATGVTLAEYTSEKLWKPAGMQDDAYWMLDGPLGTGDEWAGGGFNASARDFARLGLMVLQNGELGGEQIVPADWIEVSTVHTRSEPVIPGTPRGYGYQWWTFVGTEIHEAVGVHGQFISIDPFTNSVIVKMSYWPERGSGKHAMEHHAFFTSIRASMAD